MSDAGDEVQVDAAQEVEVSEAPKGKMSVLEALQVCLYPLNYPSIF